MSFVTRFTRSILASSIFVVLPVLGWSAPHEPVQVAGVISVVTLDDLTHGTAKLEYQLEDAQSHRHVALHFDGAAPEGMRSGTRWEVSGLADDASNVLSVGSATQTTATTQMHATAMQATTASAAPLVSGVQNTIVIIANFTDASVTSSPGQIQNLMFTDPNGGSIDALFRETSFGNVSFSGQVVGPFVINYPSNTSVCNTGGWADAADAAATAAGVNLSAYARKVYVMPSTAVSVCGAVGAGDVGGSPTRAWVFQEAVGEVYAHELGHNLNMYHASTLANEYGDASDDMSAGGYPLRHFNAPHMEQMGWMPAGNIVTVTQSGTYTVAALESNPAQAPAPQILKIYKPDTGDYYYFSYREAIGFDSGLSSSYWNHLSVHKYVGNYGAYRTYLLALLGDAGAFSDSTNGISVTQLSHTSDRATVQIQISTSSGTCQRAAPTLTLSPSSQSGNAGSALTYTLTLANKDNAYCAASTFNLASAVPSGWTGSLSSASLTLAAGASGTATLSLASPASAAAATYSAQVNVSDAASAQHAQSASVAYVVQAAAQCTRAAPTITFSPSSLNGASGAKLSYTVMIANNDNAACVASTFTLGSSLPAGWTATLSPTTLSLSPGTTSSATFVVTSPASTSAGTYPVQLNTSDAATAVHSVSASGSAVVQADTQAPTAPGGLTASVARRTSVSLTWLAATDNAGVSGYEVWRNGVRVTTTTALGYTETLPSGTYSYYVVAYDAAGNRSGASNSVSVTIRSK